jgi:predicted nucleic acid-binding protein
MRPIFIDTNAYVAFKKGEEEIIEVFRHSEVIGISPIVLGELLGGFECGNRPKKNRDELQQFLSSTRVRLFPITADTSAFYAQVYASLKNKGRPIPTNDLGIAAQALENGCMLCTHDKHFKEIEGLISGSTLIELII